MAAAICEAARMKAAEVSAGAQEARPRARTSVEHANASILRHRHNALPAACAVSLKICEHPVTEMRSYTKQRTSPKAADHSGKHTKPQPKMSRS